MKNELGKIQKVLSPDYTEVLESQREDEGDEQKSSRKAFVEITMYFLRKMKYKKLADHLQSRKKIPLFKCVCVYFFSF